MKQFQDQHSRLRFLRSLTGLTRAEIENKYTLPEITLKKWETGKMPLSEKGINKCLEIYRSENIITNKNWLRSGEGVMPTFYQSETDDEKSLEYFKNLYPSCIIHNIPNNDMLPKYSKNEVVIGSIYEQEYKNLNNRDCIVSLNKNEEEIILLRKLLVNEDKTINLLCTNPENDEAMIFDVQVNFIAPVMWHKLRNI